MKTSLLLLLGLLASLPSCTTTEEKASISNLSANIPTNLWEDQTEIYLPVTEEWTNRIEVADLNADGWLDILCANGGNYDQPGEPELNRVFLNNGPDKKFTEVTEAVLGTQPDIARVIKVADLNGDNLPDILVGTTYETQSRLYIGSGKGEFEEVTSTHLPQLLASVGDLEFGDVDDDGDLDVVLTDWGPGNSMLNEGGRTMLWLNDGAGKFTDVTTKQMPNKAVKFSWDVEFIDFDNDFDLDILVSSKRDGGGRLFFNNGKGVYSNYRAVPLYTNNYDYEPMDLNGNGYLDLVTVNDGEIVDGVKYRRRQHIFLNDSGKQFIDRTPELWKDSENLGEDDNNITFLDYDSDGDADFLISSLTGNDRLLINDGKARFKLANNVLDGNPTPFTLSLMVADMNNDQRLDIIQGQGEGAYDKDERIFIAGDRMAKDTAVPVISNYRIGEEEKTLIVQARIHDHKSPNRPSDWQSVELKYETDGKVQAAEMIWYGEYLWKAKVDNRSIDKKNLSICAVDRAGNRTCIDLFTSD